MTPQNMVEMPQYMNIRRDLRMPSCILGNFSRAARQAANTTKP